MRILQGINICLLVGCVYGWDDYYAGYGEFYRTHSKLTEVPTDIPNEAKLVYLNNNNISALEKNSFVDLSECTEIDLSFNGMSRIEAGAFSGLGSLRVLHLSHNNIQEIKAEMWKELYSLEMLFLYNSNIQTLSPTPFLGLIKLQVLNLGDNLLTEIPSDIFTSLYSLREVHLLSNRISTIQPLALANKPGLEKLQLYQNRMTSFPEDVFGTAADHCPIPHPDNLVVSLYQNPLQCDSKMCWMKQAEESWLSFVHQFTLPICRNFPGESWREVALDC